MIPRACKRLAEVDFPIVVVSRHAAREEVGPPRPPVDAACVVGAPTAGVELGCAPGFATAGSVRRAVDGGFQASGGRQTQEAAEHLIETIAGSELLVANLKHCWLRCCL